MGFFIRGLVLGFSIAAPVGPIGVLCIRRTLARGRVSGFISGLGAASADAIYGSVAALGLNFISDMLVSNQMLLGLVGGAFLCYLGIRTFFEKPAAGVLPAGEEETQAPGGEHSSNLYLFSDYGSTFFLTLTNPMTILSFAAIFAGMGLSTEGGTPSSAIALIGGVFLGSASWWLLLSFLSDVFRTRFMTPTGMRWVNRVSGLIITAFGVAAIVINIP
jgi:threonine/homoserine/homoserine lactone efflux protein